MALTGNEGTSETALLDLFQSHSRMLEVLAATSTVKSTPFVKAGIMYFLTPAVLSALLISLFILSILIFAFLQLMYVQTPEVFVNTSIDFGKIEK